MKLTRTLFLSVLAPAVVFLLVANQVAFGLGGFDQPKGGLIAVLSVPGLLVGWGSLAFLIPVLIWLVLDWWGATATGLAIKCLGAATLALALGAAFGLFGGVPMGGYLGASLGEMLEAALGRVPALALLVVMGVPGAVLAGAGFLELRGGSRAVAAQTKTARQKSTKPGRPAATKKKSEKPDKETAGPLLPRIARIFSGIGKPKKRVSNLADLVRGDGPEPTREDGEAWYPERRFDEDGNELPMEFGRARDVGGIRFIGEDEEDEQDAQPEATGAAVVDVVDVELPIESALADAIEDASEAIAEAPPPHTAEPAAAVDAIADETPATPLLPTIPELFAEPEAEISLEGAPTSESAPLAPEESDALGPVIGSRDLEAENRLPPGVRWADDPTPPSRQLWAPDEELDGSEDADALETGAAAGLGQTDTDPLGATDSESELEDEDDTGYALTEQGEALREQLPAEAEALGEALSQRASPIDPEDVGDTPSVRDSVLQALSGEAQSKSSKRYLEKLEASGIFDFMDDGVAASPKQTAGPEQQASAKKKSVSQKKAASKKKTVAKKKATPKSAKSSASKKATAKKATAKKATAKKATTGKPGAKKAASKKAATKKSASKKAAPRAKKSATRAPKQGPKTRAPAAKRTDKGPKLSVSAPRKKTSERPWKSGDWDPTRQIKQPPQALLTGTQHEQLLRGVADPTFRQAAEIAVRRGAAAPMLFSRRLGVRPHEARALVQRLVETGILDVASASGAHPARLTADQFAELRQG